MNYRNLTIKYVTDLRSRCGGSYTALSDLQTDLFIGTMNNGNYYTAFSTGNMLSNNGDIVGFWSAPFSGIMQVNYFLEQVDVFLSKHETTDAQKATIEHYIAEAKFMRAYYNYMLVYYFCGNYDAATANAPASGIPVCLKYGPSPRASTTACAPCSSARPTTCTDGTPSSKE